MEKHLMSNRTNLTWLVLLLAMAMSFASCHKNETEPNSDNPGNGGGSDPVIPVVPGDPEGTVTINLNNGADGNWYNIGIGTIHIDNANNFEGMDFVCLGEVEGLGYVTTIPTEGWSNTVAVVPGQGYVAHCQNHYARLYVVEYYNSTEGGIMGATIKYQSLFQVPICLEAMSLSFSRNAETQSIKLVSPTSVTIEEQPEWCFVSLNFNTITVSVIENTSIQRSAEVVLKNDLNTERISITQQGIAPICLETTSLTFTNEGGSQTVAVLNPTIVIVEEKPDWCSVSLNSNTIIVTVSENVSPELRSGEIVLLNELNSERISVMQEGFSAQLPYYQSFEHGFGTYTTYDVRGPQSWEIDYQTAKITGYVSGGYNANEDWLISSPITIIGVNDAKMTLVYIGRYFNNIDEEVTIWASSDYNYGNNPTNATWTQVPAVLMEGNNWNDFLTIEISLSEYVGRTVVFAVKYTSTDNKAGTIEIQSITIEEN